MKKAEELSSDWAITSFTPWDNRLNHANIWGMYRQIRERSAAVKSDAHEDFWLIGRYRDVKKAAADHKRFSSAPTVFVGFKESNPRFAPLEYDPPDHTRFRNVMAAPFRPRSIGQFRASVEGHVQSILDTIAEKRECDIVHDIAEPLSVSTVSDVLGFDESQSHRNRELALALISADYDALPSARLGYIEFINEQVDRALSRPGEGMLGDVARLSDGGRVFTRDEVRNIIWAVAVAGHHSTINGISAMLLYAAEGELRDRWLGDSANPELIDPFVEESLRIDPPVHLEGRRVTEEVEVGDVTIPAGAQVALLYGSANHDDEEFEDPESFNATRRARHFTFGHGIHTCLGMTLSRLEMSTLLGSILHRFQSVSLAGAPVDSGMVWGHHMGWDSIPARFE